MRSGARLGMEVAEEGLGDFETSRLRDFETSRLGDLETSRHKRFGFGFS